MAAAGAAAAGGAVAASAGCTLSQAVLNRISQSGFDAVRAADGAAKRAEKLAGKLAATRMRTEGKEGKEEKEGGAATRLAGSRLVGDALLVSVSVAAVGTHACLACHAKEQAAAAAAAAGAAAAKGMLAGGGGEGGERGGVACTSLNRACMVAAREARRSIERKWTHHIIPFIHPL